MNDSEKEAATQIACILSKNVALITLIFSKIKNSISVRILSSRDKD